MNFSSKSASETQTIAKEIATILLSSRPPGARVLALAGPLGAGKTTLVQGLSRSLGIKNRVLSPTFILMQPFDLDRSRHKTVFPSRVWHIDCYRIEKPDDLFTLGLHEILEDPQNLVVVEWADKIKEILPKDTVWARFDYGKGEHERVITVDTASNAHHPI